MEATYPKVYYSDILKDYFSIEGNTSNYISYTLDELEYLKKTGIKSNIKIMHELKKTGIEVVLDPWPEAKDSIGWTVLLSFVENNRLLSALKLLRRGQAANFDTNMNLVPVDEMKEMYQDIRPYLFEHRGELVNAINETRKFLGK